MLSDRAITLVVLVVGIFVLVTGAANIADPTVIGADDGAASWLFADEDPVEGEERINDTTGANVSEVPVLEDDPFEGVCIEPLMGWSPLFVIFAGILLGAAILAKVRNWFLAVGVTGIATPIALFTVLFLTTGCDPEPAQEERLDREEIVGNQSVVSGDPAGEVLSVITDPAIVVMVLLVIGIGAVAMVVFSDRFGSQRPDRENRSEEPLDEDDPLSSLPAESHSATAEPLPPSARIDNEVYRAWAALIEAVRPENPETKTPGEVAAAAQDSDFDEDAVSTITHLFEVVRYGGRPPTPTREQAARRSRERFEEMDDE